MTIQWKASGVTSASHTPNPTAGRVITFSTDLTEATKSAVGKRITVELGANSLAFLVTSIAQRFPEVIRAAAAQLDGYEPAGPGHHDFDYFTRSTRLREAVLQGLSRYLEE
jgi:hypothetical protein